LTTSFLPKSPSKQRDTSKQRDDYFDNLTLRIKKLF